MFMCSEGYSIWFVSMRVSISCMLRFLPTLPLSLSPSPSTGHLGDSGAHQRKHFGGICGGVSAVVAKLTESTRSKRKQPSILRTYEA